MNIIISIILGVILGVIVIYMVAYIWNYSDGQHKEYCQKWSYNIDLMSKGDLSDSQKAILSQQSFDYDKQCV